MKIGEQPLANAGEVGDRSEDGRDDRNERTETVVIARNSVRRLRPLQAGRRIGRKERREDGRDDRREVGGVSPVVLGPGALFRA